MGIVQVELYPKYRIHFPIKRDVQLVWRLSDERYILCVVLRKRSDIFYLVYRCTTKKICFVCEQHNKSRDTLTIREDEVVCVSATVKLYFGV